MLGFRRRKENPQVCSIWRDTKWNIARFATKKLERRVPTISTVLKFDVEIGAVPHSGKTLEQPEQTVKEQEAQDIYFFRDKETNLNLKKPAENDSTDFSR